MTKIEEIIKKHEEDLEGRYSELYGGVCYVWSRSKLKELICEVIKAVLPDFNCEAACLYDIEDKAEELGIEI